MTQVKTRKKRNDFDKIMKMLDIPREDNFSNSLSYNVFIEMYKDKLSENI